MDGSSVWLRTSPAGKPAVYAAHNGGESWKRRAAVLVDLDRRYPGIRFRMIDEQNRIRAHIRVFINGTQARDLGQPLGQTDELFIVQALSGG